MQMSNATKSVRNPPFIRKDVMEKILEKAKKKGLVIVPFILSELKSEEKAYRVILPENRFQRLLNRLLKMPRNSFHAKNDYELFRFVNGYN